MKISKNMSNKRTAILMIIWFFAFSLLPIRLFYLQIIKGKELESMAQNIQKKIIELTPERGKIYDRNGEILVTNTPSYSIYANPNLIKNPAQAAEQMAPILGVDKEKLYKILNSKDSFVWLKQNVDYDIGEKIIHMKIYGIGSVKSSKRAYPQGELAASVLGFVGAEGKGLEGLENSYNKILSGTPGKMFYLSDAYGRVLPDTVNITTQKDQGKELRLTLDKNIQYFAEEELKKIAAKHAPQKAVILAMDPNTGEILGMASYPSFHPAKWESYPQNVWGHNPSVHYTYEPGSVFKMFIAAAGIEVKKVSPNTYYNDAGYIKVMDRTIYDSHPRNLGYVSFEKGIQESLNVVFVQLAQQMGKELVYKYIKDFGFGQSTGIDLSFDESGLIVPQKDCTPIVLANMSFGQSIAATPLQVLTATCVLANGGKLLQPHLVKEVVDNDGKVVEKIEPKTIRQVISSETATTVAKTMASVVTEGTGNFAAVDGYSVAGKTGTAQVPGPGGYQSGQYVASFVGFAPAYNPKIAVLVVVDRPSKGGYYGGEVAAPAFSAVVEQSLRYWGVPRDQLDKPQKK